MFVDVAKLYVKAGTGGNGRIAFHREKYVEKGGPSGGNGGKGGDIVFVADSGLNTLIDYKYKKKAIAPNGEDGGKEKCSGRGADNVYLKISDLKNENELIHLGDKGTIYLFASNIASVKKFKKHIKNIERYKENHPGHKVVFFVFDEASAYFEMGQPNCNVKMGEIFQGKPHLWFLDKGFVDVFKNSEMDFLIWFAPYKHCTAFSVKGGKSLDLPQAVVYDVKNMEIPLKEYSVDLMESAEE